MTAAELSELRGLLSTADESLGEAQSELAAMLPVLAVLPVKPDPARVLAAMTVARAAIWDARAEASRLS